MLVDVKRLLNHTYFHVKLGDEGERSSQEEEDIMQNYEKEEKGGWKNTLILVSFEECN